MDDHDRDLCQLEKDGPTFSSFPITTQMKSVIAYFATYFFSKFTLCYEISDVETIRVLTRH